MPGSVNVNRRAAIVAMRKFLKAEGVKKSDIKAFSRVRLDDGTIHLVAVLKDERTCAIGWVP